MYCGVVSSLDIFKLKFYMHLFFFSYAYYMLCPSHYLNFSTLCLHVTTGQITGWVVTIGIGQWMKCWLQGCQEIPQSWVVMQQMFSVWISWQQNWDLLPLIGKHSGILGNVYVLHLLTTSVGRWGFLFSFITGTRTFTLHETNPWNIICQPYLKLYLFILPSLWRIFPLCVLFSPFRHSLYLPGRVDK